MGNIVRYVVKYYSEIEREGKLKLTDNDWAHANNMAYWWANDKVKELLGFGSPVTIEPLKEELYTTNGKIPMNGYKVTSQGHEHYWRVELSIVKAPNLAWRGL